MTPEVLFREAAALGPDLRNNLAAYDLLAMQALAEPTWRDVRTIYLVGCGDSHHAGWAAQMAFQTLAHVRAVPLAANVFVQDAWLPAHAQAGASGALIAISASGNTPRVVDAMLRASAHGLVTLSVTGCDDGPVARAAHARLVVRLHGPEPAPGVRTFQASLLGLLLLAIRLGELRGVLSASLAAGWVGRLALLGELIDVLARETQPACEAMSVEVAQSPFLFFAGSGPGLGSAMHGAAKMIEAAGRLAVASDTEEWLHVARFAQAGAAPLFVFAPQGHAAAPALKLASRAGRGERRVVLVGPPGVIGQFARDFHSMSTLSYPDGVPEPFCPLVHAVPTAVLAGFTSRKLGRRPFQGDDAT